MLARAWRWRPGDYARASGSLFAWLLVRAAAQAIMVVWLSRILGAADYGRFVAVVAVASFLTPFAGLGLSGVLLREGSRDPEAVTAYLVAAFRIWIPSSLTCVVMGAAAAYALLPNALPWLAVIVLVAGEVIATSITDLLSRAEQARHQVTRYGAMHAGLSITRLLALALCWILADLTVGGWMLTYAAASLAYAGGLWWWRLAKVKSLHNPQLRLRAREGLPFAIAVLSLRLQSEFNKPVLANLGFQHAGNFGAAQRAADLASLPLLALQEALWPRLYSSPDAATRLRNTGATLLALALTGGGLLWLGAPWLPLALGEGFTETASLLRWLAWFPAVQLLRNLTAFHLIHSGQTNKIIIISGLGTAVGLVALLTLVPMMGIMGAMIAIYATEITQLIVQTVLKRMPNGGRSAPAFKCVPERRLTTREK